MSASEVDALLERLVAQFESPYDFLRELVQNAMDAGSDRVEVTLETHPTGEADEVVFELSVMDTGEGMDEAIIEGELTRLFSTGKAGDRTTAGGFGIGFVSVFAWEPEVVLLQTGRGGEAWELVFRGDRSFDKYRIEQPLEGTTVHLLRRGRLGERDSLAEAVRDALWRWCRYCPLEVTFEDLESGEQPELIQDSPDPPEDALSRQEEEGETQIRVTFGVPASAVLLRRGLILAEGSPRQLLPGIADELGRGASHLQVWADSPLLRTTLARDKVVDDEGRKKIERRIVKLRAALRSDLLARLAELVADAEAWTLDRHQRYGNYHAHLGLELIDEAGKLASELRDQPLLRLAGRSRGESLDRLLDWLGGRPILVTAADFDQADPRELLDAAVTAGVPVLASDLDGDRPWLGELAGALGMSLLPLEQGLSRLELRSDEAVGLCGLVERLLQGAGLGKSRVGLGRFVDVDAVDPPLFGVHVGLDASPLAFYGGDSIPAAVCEGEKLWLNRESILVQATMRSFTVAPLVAAMSLALAMLGRMGPRAPQ
ncbi:MAG: ATP-binding protein, partial [Planctomycetota bacterium]